MRLWRAFQSGMMALLFPKRANRGIEEELEGFLADSIAEKRRRGWDEQAARRAARVEIGSASAVKQKIWDSRWEAAVDGAIQDIRLAVRVLMKSPGFALVAIVSLALGIGANTAIFTVAKHVLIDRLPVRNPEQLRMLVWHSGHEQVLPPVWGDVWSTNDGGLAGNAFSYPVIEAMRGQTRAFADLVAFKDISVTATVHGAVSGQAQVVDAEMVSGNVFAAMGIQPAAGRLLTQADDRLGTRAVVVGEGFWRESMGAAPLSDEQGGGIAMHLNGVPVTVVGVAPAHFAGLTMGRRVAVFVPVAMQPEVVPRAQRTSASLLDNPESWWLSVLVRLRPDGKEAAARGELNAVMLQSAAPVLKKTAETAKFHLEMVDGARGSDLLTGEFGRASYLLMGLSGLVLLLACVNLANLLLARASARRREMATRMALGAGRMRIARQSLTESLLLAGLGGAAGVLLGFAARHAIPRMLAQPGLEENSAQPLEAAFDWQVVVFAAAVTVLTGLLFGLVPAWRAARVGANAALKETRTTGGRRAVWLGKALVVTQVALSLLLLVGAALFVRTLGNLGSQALGFKADHLLLFRLDPPRSRYDDAAAKRLYRQLEERLAALPGVKRMTLSTIALIGDGQSGSSFHVVGRPPDPERARVQENGVGTDFLETMGIRLLAGRGFGPQDTGSGQRVAIVNEALAKRFFPKGDAVGSVFEGDKEDEAGPMTIIGVVADTRYADMRSQTPPTFYEPYRQQIGTGRMVVTLRTQAEPGSVLAQVRATVAALDPDLPLIDVRTMEDQIRGTMGQEQTFARLTSGFGLLALVLGAVGVYGILSYAVALRTSEIGIRMALGAEPRAVRWMVLRESLALLALGTAVGLPVTLVLTRVVRSQLYGLSPADPMSFAGAVAVVAAMTVIAAWIPARRAAKVDPMVALRWE